MNESDKAGKVIEALKAAQGEPVQTALPMLNGLIDLVKPGGEQTSDVDEARASAFLAICEIGKALYRGQPAAPLWQAAIEASERWSTLAK